MRRAYMHNLYILGHAKIASSILAKSTLLMLSTFIVLLQKVAIFIYLLFSVYNFFCMMIVSDPSYGNMNFENFCFYIRGASPDTGD